MEALNEAQMLRQEELYFSVGEARRQFQEAVQLLARISEHRLYLLKTAYGDGWGAMAEEALRWISDLARDPLCSRREAELRALDLAEEYLQWGKGKDRERALARIAQRRQKLLGDSSTATHAR